MANETNYSTKLIRLWKEATKGVTPGTIAQAYSVTAISLSLAETQKTEKNPTLGNGGQASRTDFGASDYAGNIECKYTGGIMPILMNQIIGRATKTTAATAGWKTLTLYAVGGIVSTTTGSHTLVCVKAGTTGATEPVYTSKVEGDLITDGTVVWMFRAKELKKYVGSLNPCLETMGIEIVSQTGCEVTPVTFTERYTGVFLNTFEIAKSGGNVIYKYSLPAVAMGRGDSEQAGWTAATITTETAIVDRAYGYDDVKILVAGVEPVNCNSFKMTINRNTALEYGVKVGERIDNTPIVTADGEMVLKFTKEQYALVYANPTQTVSITMANGNGDKTILTFPMVETLRAPLTYATDKPIYLTVKLGAVGDSSASTVSYETVSDTNW